MNDPYLSGPRPGLGPPPSRRGGGGGGSVVGTIIFIATIGFFVCKGGCGDCEMQKIVFTDSENNDCALTIYRSQGGTILDHINVLIDSPIDAEVSGTLQCGDTSVDLNGRYIRGRPSYKFLRRAYAMNRIGFTLISAETTNLTKANEGVFVMVKGDINTDSKTLNFLYVCFSTDGRYWPSLKEAPSKCRQAVMYSLLD